MVEALAVATPEAPAAPLGVNISTAAKLTGLTLRAIRYYESRGLISPGRDITDARRYGPTDLGRLEEISRLRRCGFSIGEIVDVLDTADRRGSDAGAARALELAHSRLRAVTEQRHQLERLIIDARKQPAANPA